MLSEQGPGLSHMQIGSCARFRAPEIRLDDKQRGGRTADRAFKAVQLDARASVCLPAAWLHNPTILVLPLCPKRCCSRAVLLPVNTWYWHKHCCSPKGMDGGLQEVQFHIRTSSPGKKTKNKKTSNSNKNTYDNNLSVSDLISLQWLQQVPLPRSSVQ